MNVAKREKLLYVFLIDCSDNNLPVLSHLSFTPTETLTASTDPSY